MIDVVSSLIKFFTSIGSSLESSKKAFSSGLIISFKYYSKLIWKKSKNPGRLMLLPYLAKPFYTSLTSKGKSSFISTYRLILSLIYPKIIIYKVFMYSFFISLAVNV
jgi:hypothetical protein